MRKLLLSYPKDKETPYFSLYQGLHGFTVGLTYREAELFANPDYYWNLDEYVDPRSRGTPVLTEDKPRFIKTKAKALKLIKSFDPWLVEQRL